MSDKVDKFCEALRVNLTRVEDYISKVGENLKSASTTAEEEVKSKLNGLKATHENNVNKILEAKTKIEARVAEKKSELDSTVQEWKKNREISKLESRADAAEVYAEFAVEFAMAAAVEADIATLEAVAARIDADQAVAS
jgi:hypothetical protein